MGVTAERLPRSLVSLEIEVDEERLEGALEQASRKVSRQVRIPGFRPGKAPRAIVENMVGRPALLQEAIEDLIPGLYSEAIEEQEIDAIAQPEIDLKSTEPLVVTATVPVRPTIDIGDYRALRVPREEVEVTRAQIDEALLEVRERFATLEPVDRPVEWGDTVRADVTVAVGGQAPPHVEEGAEFRVAEDGVVSLPGFLERLIGLERGEPHEFEYALPEDYEAEDLAGQTARYRVLLHEVKREVLPDLDDEFARSLDEDGIDSLERLEERVGENVRIRAEAAAESGYRDEVVDLLLATSELDYPEVLVERELDRFVDEQSNHAFHERESFDRWLEAIGRTEDEVREALREQAELSLRRGLVLAEFAEREEIDAPDEEIEAEVGALVERMTGGSTDVDVRARWRGVFDTAEYRDSIGNRIRTARSLERLVGIASQPDEDIEPRPARRRSRRRRGARGDEAEAAADIGEADDGGEEGVDAVGGEADSGGDAPGDEAEQD